MHAAQRDRTQGVLTLFRPQVKNIAHDGNITLGDVIAIARIMRPRSVARELKGTVKEIIGTCQSVGCTIDGDSATDMLQKVCAAQRAATRCNPGQLPRRACCAACARKQRRSGRDEAVHDAVLDIPVLTCAALPWSGGRRGG